MTAFNIIDDYHDEYLNSLGISSRKMYDIILRVLAENSDGGRLKPNIKQLAQLDSILREALKTSGYKAATDKYLSAFDKLEQYNATKYPEKQGFNISKTISGSQLVPHIRETVLNTLRGGGLQEGVLKPLEDLMRQEIFLKKTYTETADLLKAKLVTDSILVKHADLAAYDALHHYNGAINDEVRKKYNLKYFYYIGSEIETTRPLCDHIQDNYPGALSLDDLQIILNEFCPGGKPSTEKITYTTVNGVTRTLPKGSGMYEGTTVDNFSQRRGGRRCRHEVKWVRFPDRVGKGGLGRSKPIEPNTDVKRPRPVLAIDLTGMLTLLKGIENVSRQIRVSRIEKMKLLDGMEKIYSIKVHGEQKTVHKPDDRKIIPTELEAAKKTAEAGFDVIFTSPSQFKNPKAPDKRFTNNFDNYIVVNDRLKPADIKTNHTGTVSSIENAFATANKQAETLILDMNTRIPITDLVKGIQSGAKDNKDVKYLLLIYKGKSKILNREFMLDEKKLHEALESKFNPRK